MISGNLEYLISSLPDLTFSDDKARKSRITNLWHRYAGIQDSDEPLASLFMQEATKFISPTSAEQLRDTNLHNIHESRFQSSTNDTVRAFAHFVLDLKKKIQAYRIARRKAGVQGKQQEGTLLLSPGNPLDQELQVLRWLWQKADALTVGHHYDLDVLIIYKLKLQILERWWSFNTEKGMAVFDRITKTTGHG